LGGFPYSLGANGQITNGYISGTSTTYYFFYNWVMSGECESARTAVSANIKTAPVITVAANDSTICQNESVSLTATSANDPDYAYSWTPVVATGATLNDSPMTTTTYNVVATDSTGGINDGCIAYGSVTVTVNPSPILVSASASDSSVCSGSSINLFGNGDPNINPTETLMTESFENAGAIPSGWASELDVDGNATNATFYYTTSSTYPTGFTAYDGSYFVRFNSYSVNSPNAARLKTSNPISTIGKTGLELSFAWTVDDGYTSSHDSLSIQYSTDGTTWNTVMGIIRNDTVDAWTMQNVTLPVAAENQASLYIAFLFTSAYGNDCHLDYVNLTGLNDVTPTYTWTSTPAGFTSGNQNPVNVAPTANTTYTLAVENMFNCITTDDVTVTVNPLPIVYLGSDQDICDTTTITLDAGNPGSTYTWSTGGTSQTEDVLGSDLGAGANVVSVTVTTAAGCIGFDDVTINVTICDGIEDPSVQISYYPNPATDQLNLDLSQLPSGDYRFELLDMQGQKVIDRIIINDGSVMTLSLTDVAPGSYIISVTGNNNSFRNYLSIQK